jgi:two-component system OmpR family sensor kinase
MTLRARLTIGLIALATVGLVTTDVVSYTSLRSFLVHRVDDSLASAFHSLTTELPVAKTQGVTPTSITTYEGGIVPGFCVQLRQLDNHVLSSRCLPQSTQRSFPPAPRYPAYMALPREQSGGAGAAVRYFTVPAVSGVGHYRVVSSIEHGHPDYVLLLATPLAGAEGTLHRLFLIELVVTAVLLALLGGLGLWVVGLGLRPLAAIGETATAIAGGDLSRRVEQADDRTEIGRLGRVLNTMLGQIEAAFQAREASEQKLRRFLADASHELRTPVAAVRAYTELLSLGAAARREDFERSLRGLEQASERMSTLVDELFLLAHLDEGRPLAREEVDLENVVAQAVEVAKALEPERPFTVDTQPTQVLGDEGRLRQLVDNLLANVRAHTPAGTPVDVTLEHDGREAVLHVSDSGPGIPRESLPHVFERFYRGEAAPARPGGGSGLGLAIVAAVAAAHGGAATARSEPGAGATFTITLPLASTALDEAPGPPAELADPVSTLRNAGSLQSFLNRGR